ncbi:DNA polymerase III subunit delta' [Bordetella hinzii]|uniref:DNA polymerase III subunit delta n=5 Tax=Bordetella hinzii TaxID=103855 RepID=A0AAN1RYI5_9BORD|nr:DNA polymerase III subunit delta' [Bordetella hinzii]AKQ60451.1 DNA polymerase III subunit tau [Bordetella hinzii]AZW18501.1 DNA polymerase III subunit delta' [Bordetella hinzii]KCB25558.1 DNA polymerase III, delta' subunit [Bordetella hinzii OH87 BAL007II]KCB44819.1 DNA polymerase III, delta' subunit [Bordetella hinzii 5132]KCB50375.1 DNA polymerase III, delta' subunit [Bordetella hinzii 1277]
MSLAEFAPWHLETARAWLGQRERFAHAWLIHGTAGIGKLDFAAAAAASLLCEAPREGLACGACPACAWVAAGNHPDLRRVRPDALAAEEGAEAAEAAEDGAEPAAGAGAKKAPSKDIRIDQIRALESWFNTATHRGGWRVALVYPAQALNAVSANALLKVLEEPPAHTVFLLVADAPDRLLPTLVSRCRRLPLAAPDAATARAWLAGQGVGQAEDWLAAAGGAPLAARRLAAQSDSPVPAWLAGMAESLAAGRAPDVGTLAEALEKLPAAEWLATLQRFFTDLNLAVHGAAARYFPSLAQPLGAIAARARPAPLAETGRWLTRQRALAGHPLNAKLFAHAALQRVVLSCQG